MTEGRRRIAFVINALGPGGAERVLTTVMENTPADAWDVHLILLDEEEEHRTPPPFVTVHRMDCGGRLMPSISGLRRLLKEITPDMVVSFLVRANVAAVIAARTLGLPVVISERAQLSTHLEGKRTGWRVWASKVVPRLTYPRADHIIAVSEGVRLDLIEKFGVRANRVTSIPNPYDMDRIQREGQEAAEIALPPRFMVGVGRLVQSKGFADLIDAYAIARPAVPLVILGEGPEREALATKVDSYGLKEWVRFGGYLRNPFAVVSRAELFVSASHCEGFPNALAEAMALGVPVVATDCPSGPAELLDEAQATGARDIYAARHGLMAPVGQPAALARALEQMSDEAMRREYGRRARVRLEAYGLAPITERYWSLIAATCDNAGRLRTGAVRPPATAAEAPGPAA
jgi:glycosyltransferase involved in cell wall biosynthesis